MPIPDDFPQFSVPNQQPAMDRLRALYYQHYELSRAHVPMGTLWDEWLVPPTLWPAVETSNLQEHLARRWREGLSNRVIDEDGYVATHQHASIAHQHGWPFPYWHGGKKTAGWHFSFKNTVGDHWRPATTSTQEGCTPAGARDLGIGDDGWQLELTSPYAHVDFPGKAIAASESPFLQLRWSANGLKLAQPYIEWTSASAPAFSPDRRMYFEPVKSPDPIHYEMIPMYRHPQWNGEITQLRIGFGNSQPGAKVTIQAFFTQYDTRHNINNQSFIHGCASYFWWTADKSFLRNNINRMRLALRYLMTEHHGQSENLIRTDWVGHDGRSGLSLRNGKKRVIHGQGVGGNYWDLLPFGNKDCYATIRYYDALLTMAQIEDEIAGNPAWNIPAGPLALNPESLRAHAGKVKATGNDVFWNPNTGRFVPAVDIEGNTHDYGLTFLNLEAVYYGFATPGHEKSIMAWISGERIVNDDTSTGTDIYHWRFAPRATTKRNVEYYFWGWSAPESIPWGGQVQDGGAVMGFSYHDLMARMRTRGADDAWNRLRGILDWYGDVQAAGGYRAYYDGSREGTLQGGGTAGGLGLDAEFVESAMPPGGIIDGFLGMRPNGEGFAINPRLPSDWPELKVTRIALRGGVYGVRVTANTIEISRDRAALDPDMISLPDGTLQAQQDGKVLPLVTRDQARAVRVDWASSGTLLLRRQ